MSLSGPVLVIAPHPDDEVLGVGGTIARLAAHGTAVFVVIMTKGGPPTFTKEFVATARQEALSAHRILRVTETIFLDFPAAGVDTVPHRDVNMKLQGVFDRVRPQTVFIPFRGDIHMDHQLIFDSAMVCCRPGTPTSPSAVLGYETLSETNWNAPYVTPGFFPNTYIDLSGHLDVKIEAIRSYASQLKPPPHERSVEAIRALAILRGATVGFEAAEAFVLIRQIC